MEPNPSRTIIRAFTAWFFAVAGLGICFSAITSTSADVEKVFAEYGGSESCRDCHAEEYRLWKNSNHALAERPVQTAHDLGAFATMQTMRHGTQTSTASWSNGIATVTSIGLSGQP
ncbi:MAG: hypothetical protein JF609_06525 [Verrucomicrobia bacterium]|nr:hypothetical protein [Verrucomicrobiota bacterium]